MPLYPIASINNPQSTGEFTTKNVTVSTTVTKLLDVNTNRKCCTFFNPDTAKTVYLDVINTVSPTSAAFVIPPGSVYVSDFSWTGEIHAVVKTGTISVTIREFT